MKYNYDRDTLEAYLIEFLTMPSIIAAEFNRPSNYKIVTDLAKEYGVNLDIVILLVAINRVSLDELSEYFVDNLGLDKVRADELADKLRENFFLPILNKLAFLSPNPSPEDHTIIKDIFSKQLLNELTADPVLINALNRKIFMWLSEDLDGAKRQIENAMLNNQETITPGKITVNNEKVPGTISNWLRCFMSEQGAVNFDSLSISEFLSSSRNTANLTAEEKKILSALLNTYRNIKFFPDSMPSDDGSDWAIIPLPIVESADTTPSQLSSQPKEERLSEEEVLPQASSGAVAPTLDADRINKINQLKLLLKRYGEDSIEGQAIGEEIAKLEHGQ